MEGPLVGIFGGSFNPPHISHALACVYAVDMFRLDRLLVVPTFIHPFAKALASYEDRVRMCELAMGHLPRVEISRVEEELGGESRTLFTVRHLLAAHPDWKLRLVVGADILRESHMWLGFDEIETLAPPIVLGRAGVDVGPEAHLPEVSSTDVRTWFASGDARVERAVAPRVRDYVREHVLYAAG